jgi:hypothetical protein
MTRCTSLHWNKYPVSGRRRDYASYAISVRRAGVLPAASFRFRAAPDTLAVRLTVPTIRVRRGLAPPSHKSAAMADSMGLAPLAPCRARHKKERGFPRPPDSHLLMIVLVMATISFCSDCTLAGCTGQTDRFHHAHPHSTKNSYLAVSYSQSLINKNRRGIAVSYIRCWQ